MVVVAVAVAVVTRSEEVADIVAAETCSTAAAEIAVVAAVAAGMQLLAANMAVDTVAFADDLVARTSVEEAFVPALVVVELTKDTGTPPIKLF